MADAGIIFIDFIVVQAQRNNIAKTADLPNLMSDINLGYIHFIMHTL